MSKAPDILVKQAERYERMAKYAPPGSGARAAAEATVRWTREAIGWYEGDPLTVAQKHARLSRRAARNSLVFACIGAAAALVALGALVGKWLGWWA